MRSRRRHRNPTAVVLVAGLPLVAGPSARAVAQESLPPGAGRTLLAEACMQCHQLRAIVTQRKAEAAWRRTVDEMVWRGAPLMPGEAAVLARYLEDSFGPQKPPATGARSAAAEDPGASSLPPGPARALVWQACVGCHDLATTLMRRKTVEQWRRSVDLMVRLGAGLEPADIDPVASYLAGFLGPDARSPGGGRP
jgi:predicted secreted protein